jgi:hypothetical protein
MMAKKPKRAISGQPFLTDISLSNDENYQVLSFPLMAEDGGGVERGMFPLTPTLSR